MDFFTQICFSQRLLMYDFLLLIFKAGSQYLSGKYVFLLTDFPSQCIQMHQFRVLTVWTHYEMGHILWVAGKVEISMKTWLFPRVPIGQEWEIDSIAWSWYYCAQREWEKSCPDCCNLSRLNDNGAVKGDLFMAWDNHHLTTSLKNPTWFVSTFRLYLMFVALSWQKFRSTRQGLFSCVLFLDVSMTHTSCSWGHGMWQA